MTPKTSQSHRFTSIIVICFNSAQYILPCLKSVMAQKGCDFEVIVVDNGSSDNSIQLVETHFPQVKVVKSSQNLGYAGGINLGLQHARGTFIAPLNVDTTVAEDWLQHLVDHLIGHPSIGAVSPMVLLQDQPTIINAVGGAIHVTGLSFCNGLGRSQGEIGQMPFKVPGICGASYVIRHKLLQQMQGAPDWCFMGNDDVVISWLLRLMDKGIHCVPRSRVYHHYHLSFDAEKLYLLERNRLHLLLSSLQKRTLVYTFPLHLLNEAAILAYCTLKGPKFVKKKLKSFQSLWQERELQQELRHKHQNLRQTSDRKILKHLRWTYPRNQLRTIAGPTKARPR